MTDEDSIFRKIREYKRAYRNWINVMLQQFKARRTDKKNSLVRVVLKSNKEILQLPVEWIWTYRVALSYSNAAVSDFGVFEDHFFFKYSNNPLTIFPGSNPYLIYETFFKEVYGFLKVDNQVVVDIGANIGDTAIYFAMRNAQKIISLEPYPYLYEIALQNIEKNNSVNSVDLLNMGYGEDGSINVDERNLPNASSDLKENISGTSVEIVSLKTLVSRYNIDSAVLKMDCEGCEYHLLNEDEAVLKKFRMIQIEYHYGHRELVEKLENCGFVVEYTQPSSSYNPSATRSSMYLGYIYAKLPNTQ